MVLPEIVRHGQVEAWIDDTGFPKQGRHSVGVARQYCRSRQAGQLSERCRYRLPIRHASLPVAYRLYLPEQWAADDERRRGNRRARGIPLSGPSPRSHSSRSVRPVQLACRSVWC